MGEQWLRNIGPQERSVLEEEIRQHFTTGNFREAAELAIRGYGPEVLGYLARVLDDENDAAEVFSQFCEDLWRGLPAFRWNCPLRNWAYSLATNARHRFFRDPFRRRGRRLATAELAGLVEEVRQSTLRYLRTEVKDQFREIQRQLRPKERQLLILRIDRDLSWKEIVLILSLEDSLPDHEIARRATKLRKRFSRLNQKLRKLCRAHGLIDP